MSFATDLNGMVSNAGLRVNSRKLARPGTHRTVSQYGTDAQAVRDALAAGPGTVYFDVEVPHDATATPVTVPSDVTVIPIGAGKFKAGLANTTRMIDVPTTTRNAIWAVDIDADGKSTNAALPILLRKGCKLMNARISGWTGTSSAAVSMRNGDGTYSVLYCVFDGNRSNITHGAGANRPDNGAKIDLIGNDHEDYELRGATLTIPVAGWVVRTIRNIYRPPAATAYDPQPQYFYTADRALYRYSAGSMSLGNIYIGNDMAFDSAGADALEYPNGTSDVDVWHGADGLLQRLLVCVGTGEAAFSTALFCDDITKEYCLALETDTGYAIGASPQSPFVFATTVTTNVTLTGCIALQCGIDRDNAHAGSTQQHPGGGQHGFIMDTVDGVTFSGCSAHTWGSNRKMKYAISGTRSQNVDIGDAEQSGARNGLDSIVAP